MTPRCRFCGEFEGGNTDILQGYDICFDCIVSLMENEEERRGVAEQERQFRRYWEGHETPEDRERQQLKDAGRIP